MPSTPDTAKIDVYKAMEESSKETPPTTRVHRTRLATLIALVVLACVACAVGSFARNLVSGPPLDLDAELRDIVEKCSASDLTGPSDATLSEKCARHVADRVKALERHVSCQHHRDDHHHGKTTILANATTPTTMDAHGDHGHDRGDHGDHADRGRHDEHGEHDDRNHRSKAAVDDQPLALGRSKAAIESVMSIVNNATINTCDGTWTGTCCKNTRSGSANGPSPICRDALMSVGGVKEYFEYFECSWWNGFCWALCRPYDSVRYCGQFGNK